MNVRENLKAFLDGELTPQEQAEVQKAIDQDPALAQELEELKMITKGIQQAVKEIPVQGFEKLQSRFKPKSVWLKLILPLTALVILSAIMFPVFFQAKRYTGSADSSPALMNEAKTESSSREADMAMPGMEAPAEASGLSGGVESEDFPQDNASQAPSSLQSRQRDIIKTGEVSVQVDDLSASNQAVIDIAKRYQGYVESTSYNNPSYTYAIRNASLTIRVASNRFDQAMEEIGNMGNLLSTSSYGEDVTAQIVDSTARLKAMRAEEDQYIEILGTAKDVNQVLAVKERLNRVRQEIESLDARLKNLKDLASLSTINIQLQEKPKVQPNKPKDWVSQTATNATKSLQRIGQSIAQFGIYIGIFTPIWLPIALFIWWRIRVAKKA